MKRYILKKDHPYAPKGAIVEEEYNNGSVFFVKPTDTQLHYVYDISIPLSVMDQWLEEVKEEPTCSKEFAKDIKEFLFSGSVVFLADHQEAQINQWLDAHTSKDDQS